MNSGRGGAEKTLWWYAQNDVPHESRHWGWEIKGVNALTENENYFNGKGGRTIQKILPNKTGNCVQFGECWTCWDLPFEVNFVQANSSCSPPHTHPQNEEKKTMKDDIMLTIRTWEDCWNRISRRMFYHLQLNKLELTWLSETRYRGLERRSRESPELGFWMWG